MFEKEENELENRNKELDEMTLPATIDNYIEAGLALGKKRKRSAKSKMMMTLAASFMIITMVFTIRVSPAFAAYVSKIPGLDVIVNLINYDKGLQLAVEHDFIQPIGISDEHDGIKVTVDSVIVDESRMILFYTLENNSEYEMIDIEVIDFVNEQGEPWKVTKTYNSYGEKWLKKKKRHSKIDIEFIKETKIPDIVTFKLKLLNKEDEREHSGTVLESAWSIDIPINKAAFVNMKEEYLLNQTVTIEGQKIHFNKVTIYPTRVSLEIKYDEANNKKIFGFDDLRLVDENGEEFASITNGIIGMPIDDYTEIIYLQSNYFNRPKHLYLKASRLKALDTDKLEVIVDLQEEKLLKQPDERLHIDEINKTSEQVEIVFTYKKEFPYDVKRAYSLFNHQFKDSSGKIYEHLGEGSSAGEEYGRSYVTIENIGYTNPITFTIYHYPTRIYGDINIRVK